MPHPRLALTNQPFSWFGHPSLGALLNIETAPDSNWLQVCSRCIYDERVGGITFSRDGVCSYCDQVDELESLYGTGSRDGEINWNSSVIEVERFIRAQTRPYPGAFSVVGDSVLRIWSGRPVLDAEASHQTNELHSVGLRCADGWYLPESFWINERPASGDQLARLLRRASEE